MLYCFLFGAAHASAVTHRLSPPVAYANALCLFARLLPQAQDKAVEDVGQWAVQSTARASPWNPITHDGIDELLEWRASPKGHALNRVNAALAKAPKDE